ncbi:GNAT family N-acetyltransferase [bacterium]|nr:GNAT family N-acetyltransferase [bacterium]
MGAPLRTWLDVSPAEALAIREAVRAADPSGLGSGCVVAEQAHAGALLELLCDERVSGPIHDLPRPFSEASIARWIADAATLKAQGDAMLVLTLDDRTRAASFSRFTIWPERAAGEIIGARRADLQGAGTGGAGAARSFGWMFDVLKLRLIAVTAALDNFRSARVIEAAGFVYIGETDSVRPDGAVRRSHAWELSRDAWMAARKVRDSPPG